MDLIPLLLLALFFVAGYATRSYVGALVPGAVFLFALDAYRNRTPSGDEMDVLDFAFLVISIVGVLIYLAGVALGRRARRRSADAT